MQLLQRRRQEPQADKGPDDDSQEADRPDGREERGGKRPKLLQGTAPKARAKARAQVREASRDDDYGRQGAAAGSESHPRRRRQQMDDEEEEEEAPCVGRGGAAAAVAFACRLPRPCFRGGAESSWSHRRTCSRTGAPRRNNCRRNSSTCRSATKSSVLSTSRFGGKQKG
mmetsp:Transcript_38289/g.121934  ORF Transcript_38289/g.121934 Transcript_38289/m.121934 type:complete len:170 (-) Transcript_38289:2067-2576(-)